MWKNMVEMNIPQMTIWCKCFASWITKATDTHSEYVMLIGFHGNSGSVKVPQCYVIRMLPILFITNVTELPDFC
jgi:hypothetical protein